ncbi:MAG: hypothetical protein ACKODX_08405, partial [Gemmata sp.]
MRTASFLALALAVGLVLTGRTAAQPPMKQPLTPQQIYAKFRDTVAEGKYDIAGIFLDEFLASVPDAKALADPTEKAGTAVFVELESKYGTTAFQQLRAVPRYSDDPAAEKKVRAAVEDLNARALAVKTKLLYTPERVNKYIRNLGETYEEKLFAQQELKRTGEYAVPFMIEAVRTNPSKDVYAGILETIPLLEGPTMPGWVAALDGLPPSQQYGILCQLARRRDVLTLLGSAQTDFVPYLWRILSKPRADAPTLFELAQQLVNELVPGAKADAKRPEVELIAHARKFYEHKARYMAAKTNPDGSPAQVPVWVAGMAGDVLKVDRLPDVPVGQADEYYGLRYARWALDMKPEYAPAQALVLALASERAVERARGNNLAVTEPAVYKLLSDTPSATLIELLARGLTEKRTPLVLAMAQALGDRADREAATPPAGAGDRPSLLVRALAYPDHAVQFAAATALLRSPVPVPGSAKPQIVEILRRAAATDPGKPGESKGTVLLVDPAKFRADSNAALLRGPHFDRDTESPRIKGLTFDVEILGSGRDLLRRIARSSDFDIIVIDHHAAPPELIDTVGQVAADPRTAGRPIYVIASADKPRLPTFDQLMLRTSAMIAATENDVIAIPDPYVPDAKRTPEEQAGDRKDRQKRRDNALANAAAVRAERLQRVLDTLPLTLTANQKQLMQLRIKLVVYAILAAEYPVTPESAPATVASLDSTRKQITLQPASATYGSDIAIKDLLKLIERFELDVSKAPQAQKRYDALRAKVDSVDLGLTVETFRDPLIEAKITRVLKGYPGVKVIPEPYSRLQLEPEFKVLFGDPMMLPRDAAAKKADARTAVEYLRQMAVGDLPGYEYKLADAELRAALNHPDPDVASAAVDAVERFKTGEAQAGLLQLATKKVGTAPA